MTTPTTTSKLEELARGMSDAQRFSMTCTRYAGFGYPAGTLRATGRPSALAALQRKGLVRRGSNIFTPLGLALRSHLTQDMGEE